MKNYHINAAGVFFCGVALLLARSWGWFIWDASILLFNAAYCQYNWRRNR